MRTAEFEEREYEAPLYAQLQNPNTGVWSPGQVLEAHLGFDHALLTSHPWFWGLHGLSVPPAGVVLSSSPPNFWWPSWRTDRPLPDFSLNLFVQAKRPTVGTRPTKALKSAGIEGRYWKFSVSSHQQALLESLATATIQRALVTYACAAFDTVTHLYAHSRAGRIVEASSFPPAAVLRGHGAWYFTSPGCSGVANPTPERIDLDPIRQRIRKFTFDQPRDQSGDRSFSDNLKQLAASVHESTGAASVGGSGLVSIYFEAVRQIDRLMSFLRLPQHSEAVRNYLAVSAYSTVFGLQWHVLGSETAR